MSQRLRVFKRFVFSRLMCRCVGCQHKSSMSSEKHRRWFIIAAVCLSLHVNSKPEQVLANTTQPPRCFQGRDGEQWRECHTQGVFYSPITTFHPLYGRRCEDFMIHSNNI